MKLALNLVPILLFSWQSLGDQLPALGKQFDINGRSTVVTATYPIGNQNGGFNAGDSCNIGGVNGAAISVVKYNADGTALIAYSEPNDQQFGWQCPTDEDYKISVSKLVAIVKPDTEASAIAAITSVNAEINNTPSSQSGDPRVVSTAGGPKKIFGFSDGSWEFKALNSLGVPAK